MDTATRRDGLRRHGPTPTGAPRESESVVHRDPTDVKRRRGPDGLGVQGRVATSDPTWGVRRDTPGTIPTLGKGGSKWATSELDGTSRGNEEGQIRKHNERRVLSHRTAGSDPSLNTSSTQADGAGSEREETVCSEWE